MYLLLSFKAPVASQAKLRKHTWKNTCKKFQEIEKQNKEEKKEHEKQNLDLMKKKQKEEEEEEEETRRNTANGQINRSAFTPPHTIPGP